MPSGSRTTPTRGDRLLFSITRKDFRIDTFRSGGKGGQKQNKTSSGVRVTHIPSGAIGESRNHRSQHQNRKEALRRLTETRKFKAWLKLEVARVTGELNEIERKVEDAMQTRNLRVERRKEGKWVEWKE